MTLFNSFVGTFGLLLLFTVGVTSWVFRTSAAPVVAKMVVPACLVMLACFTPWRVVTILGYPTPASASDLPRKAELIAFVAEDDKGRVVLWLRKGSEQPRAYDVKLDAQMKKTLEAARGKLAHGERIALVKKKGEPGNRHGGYFAFDTPTAPYEIDPDAFRLPEKNQ